MSYVILYLALAIFSSLQRPDVAFPGVIVLETILEKLTSMEEA